jgi:Glycosyltransferase family 87
MAPEAIHHRAYAAPVPALRVVLLLTGMFLLSAPAAQAAVSQQEALQIAINVPSVAREMSKFSPVQATARLDDGTWVAQFGSSDNEVHAEVHVDSVTGAVEKVYVGQKAQFPLARGAESGFASRKINALWVWIPLALIFVGAFFDWRHPWRLLHLDLLAIVALGLSFAFWMHGNLDASVPLVYPTLVYVLARMLSGGFRPLERAGPVSRLSANVLIGITVVLLAVRIGITLSDRFVSDIGYASSAGADRILHGQELYTRGGAHFDTYGPLAYILYIPFLWIWPFHESVLYPPSAQAAAIAWDLLTVAGLVVLGRKTRLGWALALAWVACPFTGLAMATGSNDSLVAALLVWALVAYRSAPLSGALAGASAAAKIAPGFILPVLARGTGHLNPRRMAIALGAALLVAAVSLAPVFPKGGLKEFYDATIGFQLHRPSPFSIWSQHDSLVPLQTVLRIGSLVLAIALAFFPRGNRTLGQMAALAAAVLVAAELPLKHWFYLYVPWFLPLYCLALFSEHVAGEPPAASQQQPRQAA